MHLVRLADVCRYYQNGETIVWAVDHVDLTVHPAEFVCIVGPSGSGKTTLLNLIAGIDRPTSGHVYFETHDLCTLSESERTSLRLHQMGFVFQSYNLIPVLTARENVELILLLQNVPKPERSRRVAALMERLGLASLMDRYPHQMSGGQQQRVAVARAIVHHPKLVLADEPTANLDSTNARALIEMMIDLAHREEITFIVATHDTRLVEQADRVIHLVDGRIVDA